MKWLRLCRFQILGILIRTYGWRGILRRGVHELRRNMGWFKARPSAIGRLNLQKAVLVYRPPMSSWRDLPQDYLARTVARGQKVVDGQYEAYGDMWRQFPQTADQWHIHPSTQFVFPMVAWWKVPLLPAGSDIKDLWEPGRFGWVYDLIRAHAATSEAKYADAFHKKLESWCDANPPFLGPQWACGQEVAVRALALLHGMQSFPVCQSDPEAMARLEAILGWSGERIADAIGYGLSQRNNHGISESACLVHLGLCFRGAHPDAENWLRRGIRILDEQICDQFSADGWYAQHSFTYLRVALEQALYAERALQTVGLNLSRVALSRLDAATELLARLVDAGTGEVPNHGANDGARVLPLSLAPYRDFRPVLTLAAIIRRAPLPADLTPDEDVVRWLDDIPPASLPARRDGVDRGSSGWVVARVSGCSVFMFAGTYRHRPSHLDSLHVHIRINGREVITDPGTFAYNAPAPWANGLTSALVHNGPVLDGREPAKRGPNFLWLSWPTARIVSTEQRSGYVSVVAEQPGLVRREVNITGDAVRVIDRVLDHFSQDIQVTWLMHPDAIDDYTVCAEGSQRIAAREHDVTGWFSPTYGSRNKSCSVRITRRIESMATVIETTIRASTRK